MKAILQRIHPTKIGLGTLALVLLAPTWQANVPVQAKAPEAGLAAFGSLADFPACGPRILEGIYFDAQNQVLYVCEQDGEAYRYAPIEVADYNGEPGEKGPAGDKGDVGDEGADGPVGDKGDQGEAGDKGAQGLPGEDGDPGADGPQGPQGLKPAGPKGIQGPQGDQGPDGPQGVQGPPKGTPP